MTRSVYRLTGGDARHFLQGLITNDLNGIDKGLVYTAMLTPQGKYIADFFLLADGDAVLLDVSADIGAALVQRLGMYKLRADVQITQTYLGVARGTGAAPSGAWADPRHEAMGWRLYGAAQTDDGSDWDAIRVAHCIPETGIELTPDTFILEAGMERLHGVDFRKGCYVGQEVTARMKHKTELRKGLVRVTVSAPVPVGTEIMAGEKPAGVLYTQAGGEGIAYLRLDRAKEGMQAGDAQVALAQD